MPEDFVERDSMALGAGDLPKLRAYEPLQLFFMLRLARLLRLRQQLATTPLQARLLSKAIYSTYQDCLELGLEEDVRTVFKRIGAENLR